MGKVGSVNNIVIDGLTWRYLVRDLGQAMVYLPFGVLVFALLWLFWRTVSRWGQGWHRLSPGALAFLQTYGAILLMITFLSRESGSVQGIDLQLFSTFGPNGRNSAFALENILLFLPLGFGLGWVFDPFPGRRWLWAVPALASLAVESLQLATGRGFFQLDDLWTNTLGGWLGLAVYFCMAALAACGLRRSKRG